jgi:signal peptide peptidase SppA
MNYLAHVADRIIGRPLMILPAKLELIVSVLGERIGAAIDNPTGLDPRLAEAIGANRFVGEPGGPTDNRGRRRMMYRQDGGVAILDVMGSLVNRGAWLGASSGMTSYEGLAAQLDAAVSDPSVRAILLDIDSPGGEATGAFAFYEALRAARERKAIVAQVNDTAASAAYGIAAQADHVVISPSSIVGSIGVVMMHMDRSKALEKQGNKPTLIYAGAHKVDGNSFEPLSASVRDTLQREVDSFYDRFVEGVAAGRSMLSERAIRATEAQTYIGATAIEIGLADRIGSFTETLARLASRSITGTGGRSMTNRIGANDDPRVYSQAEHDAAIIAARAAERADLEATHTSAVALATAAARKETLDRVRAIVNCAEAKGREAAALTMALESDIPVEGAAKLLNSIPIVEAKAPIPSVAARSAPQLGSDPGSDKVDPMIGWNKAIEKANAQAGVKPQRAA